MSFNNKSPSKLFNNLPNELLLEIFCFLSIGKDIVNNMCVSKKNYEILNQNIFWELLFKRDFGDEALDIACKKSYLEKLKSANDTVRELFKKNFSNNFSEIKSS